MADLCRSEGAEPHPSLYIGSNTVRQASRDHTDQRRDIVTRYQAAGSNEDRSDHKRLYLRPAENLQRSRVDKAERPNPHRYLVFTINERG